MRGLDIILTLICVFLIGCGQILFKLAARTVEFDGMTWRTLASWLTPPMVAALTIYAAATLLWVWVLRTAPLAVVYPLYALAFILVPVLAWIAVWRTDHVEARHRCGADRRRRMADRRQ